MKEAIIHLDKISKEYTIGQTRSTDIRNSIQSFFSFNKKNKQSFFALKDISLDIFEGEIFGIVGPNGSGKSTLLKILSGITYPSSGRAILRGSVSSLLEVGTGFHPELTGRENIFLNGSLLGMKRKEIRAKFEEIIDFSGVEKFIDTPVKHYSSGMYVRLAFSIAAHLEPDILLVDEVLSVGDQDFRKKSLRKMENVADSGKTVVFVSHNLGALKNICTKGAYLNSGKIRYTGEINKVLSKYGKIDPPEDLSNSKSDGDLELLDFQIRDINNSDSGLFQAGDQIKIISTIKAENSVQNLTCRIEFFDESGTRVLVMSNYLTGEVLHFDEGTNILECVVEKLPLNEGLYKISLDIKQGNTAKLSASHTGKFEVFKGAFYKTGLLPYKMNRFLVEHNWKSVIPGNYE